MNPEREATASPTPAPQPVGIGVASTLCWIIGIVTILTTLALVLPAATGPVGTLQVIVNLAAGVAVCIAGYLVRHRRRLGALIVVAAWALPTIVAVVNGAFPRGNFLLLAAMLMLLLNWKNLR
jgi:hypothetical protein